jgi:hypothetical protein
MSVWNVQEPWTAKVLQRKEVVFFTDSAERFSKLIALHRGKTSPIF